MLRRADERAAPTAAAAPQLEARIEARSARLAREAREAERAVIGVRAWTRDVVACRPGPACLCACLLISARWSSALPVSSLAPLSPPHPLSPPPPAFHTCTCTCTRTSTCTHTHLLPPRPTPRGVCRPRDGRQAAAPRAAAGRRGGGADMIYGLRHITHRACDATGVSPGLSALQIVASGRSDDLARAAV